MRVTNNMLTQNLLWNVNHNLASMNTYQKQLASGKRVHAPSDDPIGVTKIIKYKSDIAQNSQYKTNTRDAIAWMEITENSLMDSKDILQRIRELTVQGANGTLTTQETTQISKEVDQLKDELIKIGNASIAGKYIFSGFNTNEKLFNNDGTFNIDFTSKKAGNFDFIEYETGPSTRMVINTHPLSIYGMVAEDNYMTQNMPVGSDVGSASTKGHLTDDFNLNADHSAANFTITIDEDGPGPGVAKNFVVDTTTLTGTVGNPISKDEVIKQFKGALSGTDKLEDVADVYFDHNDKLVVKSKVFGATPTVAITGGTANYNPSFSAGVNGAAASVTAGSNAPALTIPTPAGQETASFVVKYNGEEKRFDLDMTSYADLNALETDINAKLSAEFGAGNVTVSIPTGPAGPMSFTTAATTDGTVPELEVDYIATKKSKLISDLDEMITAFNGGDQSTIKAALTKLDGHIDNMVTNLADVGARTNRLEFIDNRIADNELSLTKLLSEVQDVDVSKTIIMMKALENVYRASLSVGSKVIQPTLVDFIR